MNTREKLNNQIRNFALGRKAIDDLIGSYDDTFSNERHAVEKENWEATRTQEDWDE